MIQTGTVLQCADNSGASLLRCIGIPGGTGYKIANIGNIIVVSAIAVTTKRSTGNLKILKGDIHKALIIRTKKGILRTDGSLIRFDSNAAILINKQFEPLGTRVFGPIARELRSDRFIKVISLALEVL